MLIWCANIQQKSCPFINDLIDEEINQSLFCINMQRISNRMKIFLWDMIKIPYLIFSMKVFIEVPSQTELIHWCFRCYKCWDLNIFCRWWLVAQAFFTYKEFLSAHWLKNFLHKKYVKTMIILLRISHKYLQCFGHIYSKGSQTELKFRIYRCIRLFLHLWL
jgi:hypothetical protein